jgi:AraC-like DNA-binding protein
VDTSLLHGVFWNHLVYPELSSDETEDPLLTVAKIHEESLGGQFPDYVVCLSLDDYYTLSGDERRQALDSVKRTITSTLPPHQRALLGVAHTNSLYWCGTFEKDEQPTERLESLRLRINETTSLSVTIGIAYLIEKSISGWRNAAQLAVVAQRNKVRLGGNRVIVYDQATMSPSPFLAAYWRLGDMVYNLVRSGKLEQVEPVMDEVCRSLFTTSYLGLIYLRPILQSLVILMAQGAIEVGVESTEAAFESERCLSEISTTYDYARLKQLLETAAETFTDKVHARFYSSANQLASIAEDFIKEHLFEPDLSLHYLSRALGVNASYLSRTFKKAIGMGVVDYTNRLRIDEARRLLLNQKTPITEIAFQLGFGSVQHFGRVFKASEGCSPSEYRSKHVQMK